MYIFKLELTNENSSLYSKTKPINYNTNELIYKVPETVKKPIDKKI